MTPVKKTAKAAPKRAAKPKTPAIEPAEGTEQAKPAQQHFVTFLGRKIEVKLPTPEQLIAWDRVLGKLANLDPKAEVSMERAAALLGRLVKVIDAVVMHEEDREWLEDGRMSGTVTSENSSQIVLDAIDLYKAEMPEADNRAARRRKA